MRRIVLSVIAVFCLSLSFSGLTPEAFGYGKGKQETKEKKRKPVLEYERFRRTREVDVKLSEMRKSIREKLEALLKYEKDSKERPALLFRLAENYFEEATSFFNQAQRLDEKLAKDPENKRLREEIALEKKRLKGTEDKWRSQAIEIYRQVIKDYPHYPERDQVLFYLAYSLWDMERYKEALTTYRQMIKAYPNSKYIPDAYLAFGEYYFDQAKLERALMAYKKAAEFKEATIYPYAIYKQGWCYYNLHEWEKAKEMFQSVIYLADMEGEEAAKKIEIRKEALNDFVLTYSHSGSASAAPRVFKRLAPKESHKMLTNLARMYFADGQDKKAIIMFTWLINEEKCSAEVPFYQGRVVDCGSRVGNKRYAVQQVRKLIDVFAKVKKCLKSPSVTEQNRLKEARELAEVTLRRLSSVWYKEAKETKQKETFEYAGELFGDYLTLFPNSKDAYDMRFAYAELLFHRLGRNERAASEYTKVVGMDMDWKKKHKTFPPKGKKDKKGRSAPGTYLCDAAYKSVLAHREIMKKERKKERRSKKLEKTESKEGTKSRIQKRVIPKGKKRFIQAAEIYLDNCPKDRDLCSVKFDIAKTFYDYSHFDQSQKRFDEVVRDCADDDLAEYAANLVLDTLNLKEDWDNLNKYARKYYSNKTLMKKQTLKEFLQKLIPQIAFKRIAGLEDRLQTPKKGKRPMGKTRIAFKVGMAYVRFVKEFGTHDLADEALFNAGVKFEQAERLDLAKKARDKLIKEYPTSDLVPGTIFNLAENFERMTDFDSAATLYEQYASTYKKMKGLGKAVSYKERKPKKRRGKKGKRKKKKAKKVAKKAEKEKRFEGNRRTWNSEDAQASLMNAGIYREALHQYSKAIDDRLEFVKLFPRSDDAAKVYYSLGLLYEKMKKRKQAADVFKRYSEDYFRANPDRAIAAHMKRAAQMFRLKNRREAEKEMHTTLSLYRKHSRKNKNLVEAAEAAAQAQFILSEPIYLDFIKYKFKNMKNEKLIKKQLADKTKLFQKVERAYTDIAKLKQPEWAIASLYKLGRAYENFAETFYKAPPPKGLKGNLLDTYNQMVREKGQPFEDKAVAHFKAAVDKGSELGFYSRYTQRALDKLQHYRPAEYPREDLGFKLSVVPDTAFRNPLLLATWSDILRKPDLLNEPALTTQRVGGGPVETAPAPEETPREETPKAAPAEEPKAEEPKKPEKAEKAEEAKPEKMPGDPVEDAMGDEPEDDFD